PGHEAPASADAPPAVAQDDPLAAQQAIDTCRTLSDAQRRLICYDAIPGASVAGGPALTDEESAEEPAIPLRRSRMTREWELDDATDGGEFRVRSYRPVYALPLRYTTDRNRRPLAGGVDVLEPEPTSLDSVEVKFQVSLKTKLFDDPIANNGDLWFGYTQQSNWQAYNTIESEPFRETNYAPEIWSTWRTGLSFGGWTWRFVNLGFVHQSNGRSEPRSRSWNRVYANFGFERGPWQVYVRPWVRVEEGSGDDNPDIEDYFGHGDLRVRWHRGSHDFEVMARAVPGERRGAVQFDWHYPLFGDLKAYLQLFHGYGETLIDYNHRQSTIGIGVSLVQ
ncbi:MAG: phospholipase A, partial [Wenzhouxiangellaceae bacterium]|nr:phospholipase A [Wenzhouxiangellaceae bacterium]